MYNELYNVWKKELENEKLGKLSYNFYTKIADYVKKLKEENRMLDKKTVKAKLLKSEMSNVKRMLHELILIRYRKLVKKAGEGSLVPKDILAMEELKIYRDFSSLFEAYQKFAKNLMQGHVSQIKLGQERKRTILRFLKNIPAIIGIDMQTYGPFKIEDVASLPVENAKLLVKKGLAIIVATD